jgi:hypothetical protein
MEIIVASNVRLGDLVRVLFCEELPVLKLD